MIHVCSIHVITDMGDQRYSNLLDSRGHYVQCLEMSSQLGLFENISVIISVILVVFLIS